MREALPYITGPGSVFGIFLFLYLWLNKFINFSNFLESINWFIFIGVFVVIIAPIYNIVFHMLWNLITNGYQNFGYQKELIKKYSRENVVLAFDKVFYYPDKEDSRKGRSDSIEYARRRVSGFLLNLQFRWAVLVAFLLFIFFEIYKNRMMSWADSIIIVVSILVFIVSWFFTNKIHLEEKKFEKKIVEKDQHELKSLLSGEAMVKEKTNSRIRKVSSKRKTKLKSLP